MLKKLWYWLKINLWETNKDKIAEEICKAIKDVKLSREALLDINSKYKIKLDAQQLDKVYGNLQDIICDIIRRQI